MFGLFCQSLFNDDKPVCIATADSKEILHQLILDSICEPYRDTNVLPMEGPAGNNVLRYFKPGPLFDYHIPFKAGCDRCEDPIGIVAIRPREKIVSMFQTALKDWDDTFSKALKIEH